MNKFPSCRVTIFIVMTALILTACSRSSLEDNQGNSFNLSDLQGKWVFINYWATWCKPCYQEIPQLNAFYEAHKNTDVIVLGVNYDRGGKDSLANRIEEMGIQFPVLLIDPAPLIGIKEIQALPITFILGPDGKLRKTLLGEQTQQSLETAMKNST